MLIQLWYLAFPTATAEPALKGPHWGVLGFQSANPASDFRGAGAFALHCMLFYATTQPDAFRDIVTTGRPYPWVAGGSDCGLRE